MKDIRSTVMQLSGRWGNTCYATLCLAVEAALDLPYGDVQMKHLWSAIHERTGKSPQAISRALARAQPMCGNAETGSCWRRFLPGP